MFRLKRSEAHHKGLTPEEMQVRPLDLALDVAAGECGTQTDAIACGRLNIAACLAAAGIEVGLGCLDLEWLHHAGFHEKDSYPAASKKGRMPLDFGKNDAKILSESSRNKALTFCEKDSAISVDGYVLLAFS